MIARSLIASIALISCSALAQNTPLPSTEKLAALSESKQWAHLLHYRVHSFSRRYISQNDSANFFLADNGKTSLLDELQASLQAFMRTGLADNQSAQCQFPARYH